MIEIKNLLSKQNEENKYENLFRPTFLKDFIGQEDVKKKLKIYIQSAKEREKILDHILFYGPPGLGKTSLANIIAKEVNTNIRIVAAPSINKTGDLAAILSNLNRGDILFIDEIHRLPVAVEEMLYSAIEDFKLDIITGEGPSARIIKIDINEFTLIGATTRLGLISKPLKDRFGIIFQLEFYKTEELSQILNNILINIYKLKASKESLNLIASISRGTPRVASNIIKRVADINLIEFNSNIIDEKIALYAIKLLGINEFGLDKSDIKYIKFIFNSYKGGPVGIETISGGLSEDKQTIQDNIEPFLLQIGFILKTSKGRILTDECIKYIKNIDF